jgi:hypothetical protein
MTVTKTKFTYRVDRWDARGDTILDHIGGLDDLEVATATYEAACKRWPREPITLRQGTRVIEDSRRKREPYEPRIFEGRVMLPEEIQRIHQEIVSFERIEAISDPMRELIEDLWPELVDKLPPKQ